MPEKPRGRPRKFDEADALKRAIGVFLSQGYDGASLDALTRAMGVAKPSLYAAFGDKRALFLKGVAAYAAEAHGFMAASLEQGDSLEETVRGLLESALAVYAPEGCDALGCLMATTASSAAGTDAETRKTVGAFWTATDALIAAQLNRRFPERFAKATLTPEFAARWLTAIIQSLALRARSGEAPAVLRSLIENTVSAMTALSARP